MTQRQISHPAGEIPDCADGHAGHHIHDFRGASAGGGHSIECACRRTSRHPTFDAAALEWRRMNTTRKPRASRKAKASPLDRHKRKPQPDSDGDDSTVLQFPLPLQLRRRKG